MAQESKTIKVIVFDLNGTFYNKSSKDEFFKFVCAKKPQQARYIFQMAYYKLLHKMNQIRHTEFKENFFNYLDNLPPDKVKEYAEEFWAKEYPDNFNKELLNHFEKMKKQDVDIFCATGGLEVYVQPLFERFKIDGFAGTKVRYENNTYKVIGKACKEEEKLKRIAEHYKKPDFKIIEAYSDSKEDILDKAEKAFLVRDGEITPYS
jgi:HAD superfamily phosphoserine phosphatase-like hydrolase